MSAAPENVLTNVLKRSWDVFMKDPVLYVIAGIIVIVVGALTLGILAPALSIGFTRIVRDRMQGKPAEASGVFGGMSLFVPSLIAMILIAIGVTIGTALLVLPGLFVAVVTSFAFQFMALDNAGVGDSLSRSYRLVMDNLVTVILLIVLLAVINCAGGAVAVGILLTTPFTMVAMVIAYEDLRKPA